MQNFYYGFIIKQFIFKSICQNKIIPDVVVFI